MTEEWKGPTLGFLLLIESQRKGEGLEVSINRELTACTDFDYIPYLGNALNFCENTGPFNVTGHPALTINAGFSDGLPVGMMIVGRTFDEATVLNVAFSYERLRDTS